MTNWPSTHADVATQRSISRSRSPVRSERRSRYWYQCCAGPFRTDRYSATTPTATTADPTTQHDRHSDPRSAAATASTWPPGTGSGCQATTNLPTTPTTSSAPPATAPRDSSPPAAASPTRSNSPTRRPPRSPRTTSSSPSSSARTSTGARSSSARSGSAATSSTCRRA